MRILGIDYGLKRVGLAVTETELAQPLKVIKNDSRLLEKLIKICQTKKIEKIVIGLPEGEMALEVDRFGKKLSRVTNLPIAFQDETLTSQDAVAKMIQAGKKRKARQRMQDAIAAALILQSYLDKLRE